MKLSEIITVLEDIAPPDFAMPGDRIGLQIGQPDQDVRRVIVTLDVTPAVTAEAARVSADLVIAHHPLIYHPLLTLRFDSYPQSLVCQFVKSEISLYIMHTNYDAAEGGINDVLADRLGLANAQPLEITHSQKQLKLVVFVPEPAVDSVSDALAGAGAGVIGNYTHCSFRSTGTGTFMPMSGAQPFVGKVGRLEQTPEIRLEVLVHKNHLREAISAMLSAHPYEEPAFDVYPVENEGRQWGIGRYGPLREAIKFSDLCWMVRDVLEVPNPRVLGNPELLVKTLALVGGGGGGQIELAHSKGVDAYVTGDVNHHQFMQAQALGLCVIDATHFRTERPGMAALAPRLETLLSSRDVTVQYLDDFTLAGGNGS